jgi:hypothetical protein
MEIVETAHALAQDVAVAQRLFEVLGAWSTEATDPDLARTLAVLSRHQGDHAQWLAALQPVLHDVEGVTPEVSHLDGVADGDALAGVLSELLAGYDARIAAASEIADGPVTRALRLIVTDLRADLSLLTT